MAAIVDASYAAGPPTRSPHSNEWPDHIGLLSGIFAVICGQVVVISYHYWHLHHSKYARVQSESVKPSSFWQDALGHISQPEGFVLLGSYLAGTWMFNLMPASYYSWEGGINIIHLFIQEHKVSPYFYQRSHKPHHRFLNPKMFDAFNGSLADTFFMILIPLFCTAQVEYNITPSKFVYFPANLLNSEVTHPWDPLFRKLGFGTAGDHHVHHRCFIFNYGHLFMWWDKLFGTYKSPMDVASFNKNI